MSISNKVKSGLGIVGGVGAALAIWHIFLSPVASFAPRTGWFNDPNAVAAIKASLDEPYFGDTAAGKAFLADDGRDVLLTDAAKYVRGDYLPPRDQGDVGSCVSFGTSTAIEHLILVQMAKAQQLGLPPPTDYKDLVQEVVYGGSRIEIGGGQIRGDGSVTAWAAKFVQQWGVVPRGKYGAYDLTKYNTLTCRKFGATGVPAELETEARKSPVKAFTFVRNADEAAKAIRQGYPIAVGSGVGFGSRGPWPRDKDGFLRASGSWGHCMAVLGVVEVNGRRGFLWVNSWGDKVHTGPTGGKAIPASGCFFVDWATANAMFAEGDAVAFSDAVGFEPRRLPEWWFLGVKPKG